MVVSENQNNGNAGEPRGNLCLGPSTEGVSAEFWVSPQEKKLWDCVCKLVHFCQKTVRNPIHNAFLNTLTTGTAFPRVPLEMPPPPTRNKHATDYGVPSCIEWEEGVRIRCSAIDVKNFLHERLNSIRVDFEENERVLLVEVAHVGQFMQQLREERSSGGARQHWLQVAFQQHRVSTQPQLGYVSEHLR